VFSNPVGGYWPASGDSLRIRYCPRRQEAQLRFILPGHADSEDNGCCKAQTGNLPALARAAVRRSRIK
jgi:hypothetical protein